MEGRRPLEGGWQPDSDPRGKETLAAPLSLSRVAMGVGRRKALPENLGFCQAEQVRSEPRFDYGRMNAAEAASCNKMPQGNQGQLRHAAERRRLRGSREV